LGNLLSLDEVGLSLDGALDVFRDPFLRFLEVLEGVASLLGDPVALNDAGTIALLAVSLEIIVDLFDEGFQLFHDVVALPNLGIDAFVDGSVWKVGYFCFSGRVTLKYSLPLFYNSSVASLIDLTICAALVYGVDSEASVPASETSVSLSLEPMMEGSWTC
jgi:hypothetical protein